MKQKRPIRQSATIIIYKYYVYCIDGVMLIICSKNSHGVVKCFILLVPISQNHQDAHIDCCTRHLIPSPNQPVFKVSVILFVNSLYPHTLKKSDAVTYSFSSKISTHSSAFQLRCCNLEPDEQQIPSWMYRRAFTDSPSSDVMETFCLT